LAHDRGCEAELATLIAGLLAAGELPDMAAMRARFSPDPTSLPNITVPVTPLEPMTMPSWPPCRRAKAGEHHHPLCAQSLAVPRGPSGIVRGEFGEAADKRHPACNHCLGSGHNGVSFGLGQGSILARHGGARHRRIAARGARTMAPVTATSARWKGMAGG